MSLTIPNYDFAIADGSFKALTAPGPDDFRTVSPDGNIAHVGHDDVPPGHQVQHLYLMNRDGATARAAGQSLQRYRIPQPEMGQRRKREFTSLC